MRPQHAAFLSDLLKHFDWNIPEHPRTTLVSHLRAISAWSGVSRELKSQIDAFLKRYEASLARALTSRRG